MSDHDDVIIIGTGAGGGTLLHKLAPSGKRILVLERGPFLPREKENWDTKIAFNTARYLGPEVWYDKNGGEVRAGMCYHVGGNTKLYGAALFRLSERDSERVQHAGGFSPEWPVKYCDFEPYYTKAEKLYQVHGKIVVDYTENNTPAFDRLMAKWTETLKSIGCGCHILPNGPNSLHEFGQPSPAAGGGYSPR